jgi:Flp pilus assembly protein TadD
MPRTPDQPDATQPAGTSRTRRTLVLTLAGVGIAGVLVYLLSLPPVSQNAGQVRSLPPAQQTLRRVRQMLDDGQSALAVELMRNFIADHPDDRTVRPVLAETLLYTGQADRAREVVEEMLALEADAPPALWLRGLIAQREGRDPSSWFRRAAEQNHAGPRIWAGYGLWLLQQGNEQQAGTYLRKARDAGADDPMTDLALGELAYRKDRFDEAERHLLRATRGQPDNIKAWVLLGNVQRHLGRTDEAVVSLRHALELARGTQRPAVQAQLARAHMALRQYEQAAELYLAAASYPPAAPEAMFFAARSYYLADQHEKALQCMDRLERLGHNRPDVADLKQKILDAREATTAKAARQPASLLEVPPEARTDKPPTTRPGGVPPSLLP